MKKISYVLFSALILFCTICFGFTSSFCVCKKVYAASGEDADTNDDTASTDNTAREIPDDTAENYPGCPTLNTYSALVMDASTGAVLYNKNGYDKKYPASITKIMTCLLALENTNLTDTLTATYDAVWGIDRGSNHIGLVEGEQISMEEALYGLMLESANEVAWSIGDKISGDIDSFASLMNERAVELGCIGTHFVNANGLPDDNHYTCCYDMALITKEALKFQEFRTVTSTLTYEIKPTNLCDESRFMWQHNKMIREGHRYYYQYCEGGKTGYTTAAGNTLVTWNKKGDREIIVVIMDCLGAGLAYKDDAAISDYVFDNYTYLTPLSDYTFSEDQISQSAKFLNDYYSCKGTKNIVLQTDTAYQLSMLKSYTSSVDDIDVTFEGVAEPVFNDSDDKYLVGNLIMSFNDKEYGRVPVYAAGYKKGDPANNGEKALSASADATKKTKSKGKIVVLFIFIFIIMAVIILLRYIQHIKLERARLAKKNRQRRR